MSPQEKALQYIVNPGQFVARRSIDRSETYQTFDNDPSYDVIANVATLNDGDTSMDETSKQWERFNAAKHSRAYRFN